VKPHPPLLRRIGGGIVLLVMAAIGLALIPSYAANRELQSFITGISRNPGTNSPEAIRAAVVNKAASLGLPVRSDDVTVELSSGRVRIDVLYIVHIAKAGYSLDMHFRPSADSP
jgi:hypothetical protein